MRIALLFASFGLIALSPPASGDDYLMFGPSLAVYLQALDDCDERGTCRTTDIHDPEGHGSPDSGRGLGGGDFDVDESHFATDAGHDVTIVDEIEWGSMTTEQFAAYDAIVIGDAGCNFDDGERLQPLIDNIDVWSPAVTGHSFLHTFDNVYHYNNNEEEEPRGGGPTSPEQFDAMRDLAVDGMEFAASGGSTGLYYANGCRDFDEEGPNRGSTNEFLAFLGQLASITIVGDLGGNDVTIVQPGHPSMLNLTDAFLSDWGASFHAYFIEYDPHFELLATGEEGEDGPDRGGDGPPGPEPPPFGDVIIASTTPLGGGASVLQVPTAGAFGLSVFALLLGVLGWLVVARRA